MTQIRLRLAELSVAQGWRVVPRRPCAEAQHVAAQEERQLPPLALTPMGAAGLANALVTEVVTATPKRGTGEPAGPWAEASVPVPWGLAKDALLGADCLPFPLPHRLPFLLAPREFAARVRSSEQCGDQIEAGLAAVRDLGLVITGWLSCLWV